MITANKKTPDDKSRAHSFRLWKSDQKTINLCSPCVRVEAELLFITATIIPQQKPFVNTFLKKYSKKLKKTRFSLQHKGFLAVRHYPDIQKQQKGLRQKPPKIYALYFCTNFFAKNRTKWIFTKFPQWCIIKIPNKEADPRQHLFPAQPVGFREISS